MIYGFFSKKDLLPSKGEIAKVAHALGVILSQGMWAPIDDLLFVFGLPLDPSVVK